MFEIVPEPEFSDWFEHLSESDAEQVAGALDVVASCGTAVGPARVSRLLLWYDGTGGVHTRSLVLGRYQCWPAAHGDDAKSPDPQATSVDAATENLTGVLTAAAEKVNELLSWHADMARALESPAFVMRLGKLPSLLARQALEEVERLKRRLRAVRTEILLRHAVTGRSQDWSAARGALDEPFQRVLALVGIEPRELAESESGLRELSITSTSPKLRVLFGIDPERRRIVAILGEPLTRSYYGDSVRLAERRWADYGTEQESAHSP